MKRIKYVVPFLAFCSSLFAITATWTPVGGGNWNAGANWSGGTFPNNVDDVAQLFNSITANSAITLGQDITLGTLQIDSGFNYTVQANNLLFQASSGNATLNITNANGNGAHVISSNIALSSPLNISQASTMAVQLSGVISGSQTVNFSGANTLTFGGTVANTYTGLTTISAGTLQLSKTAGIVSLPGSASITGGILQPTTDNQFSGSSTIAISGGTFDFTGTAQEIGALNFQSGTLTFGTSLTLASNTTALTMRGGLTIPNPLVFSGSGAIAFDATNNGTATISGGMDLGGAVHNFDIANGTAATDMLITGVISNGGVTKIGTGTLEFNGGAANTYTGLTTVAAGTLSLNGAFPSIPGNLTVTGGTLINNAGAAQIDNAAVVTVTGGTWNLNGITEVVDSLTYTGGAVVQGGGTLNLQNGTTAFSMGGTALNGPIIIFGGGDIEFIGASGTATIAGTLDLNGNIVTFDIADGSSTSDMAISSVISNGGVTKVGAGILEFNGGAANTYAGTTTVSAGTLNLNAGGTPSVPGPVVVNGGTLFHSAGSQIATTSPVTVSGGTWNLNGKNETVNSLTYTGGSVVQSGGLLTLANAGVALTMRNTSLTGPIALTGAGSTVEFDNTNNGTATINGTLNLSGNAVTFDIADGTSAADMVVNSVIFSSPAGGSLTKTGAGTLVLGGANTYGGGTTVTAGTLQGTTTSLQGAIANSATLVFDQSFNGVFSGTLSGAGDLLKEGIGSVIFNTPQVAGNTTINGGTLTVNSTLGPAGPLTVNALGTLAGTGTITKDVTVNGTLSPGDNGIGTINLIGTQTMNGGSTLLTQLTPTQTDLVNVTGTFTINGGTTFNFTPASATYVAPLSYTVVQTTAGVTGTFTNVVDPFPLFQGVLDYSNPNLVVLNLLLVPVTSLQGLSSNAQKVAECLEELNPPPGDDLYTVINSLRFITTLEGIEKALLSMQPSAFTALAVMKESSTLYFRNAIYTRLDSRGRSCQKDEQGYHFWIAPIFGISEENNHGKEPGYHSFTPGIALGMDGFLLSDLQVGGSLGYTHSYIDWNRKRGNASIDALYGSLFTRYGNQVGYLEGAFVGGYDYYSTTRDIRIGGLIPIRREAEGHHHGFEMSLHLKGGCNLPVNVTRLGPYASVDLLYLYESSFSERGADSLNLNVSGKHSDLLQTELGMEFSHCYNLTRQSFNPFIQMGGIWEKRFTGDKIDSTFEGCPLDVRGYSHSRLLVGAGAGFNIEWALKNAPKASLAYKGKYGRGYQDHSINFELIY
ncbi:MAG: autotransporter domain-containing protein [Simkaniaceae bacterium]